MLTKEEKNELRALLERMYKLNGDDTFSDLVSKIWKFLGVEEECNVMAFEASMIKVIQNHTKVEEHASDYQKRNKAKKGDLLLLMFGLMDGYYHSETNDSGDIVSITSKERTARYINKSDYTLLNPPETDTPENTVYRAQRREIEYNGAFSKQFKRVVSQGIFKKYVEEYIDSPPETIELPDGRRRIVLPQPSYTLKKFPPGNKTKNNNCADNSVRINDGAPNNLSAEDNETTYTSAPDEVIKSTLQNDLEKPDKQESESGSIQDVFLSVVEQEKESGFCSSPTENVSIDNNQKHIKPPEPCYTRENFPPIVKQDEALNSCQLSTEGALIDDDPTEDTVQHDNKTDEKIAEALQEPMNQTFFQHVLILLRKIVDWGCQECGSSDNNKQWVILILLFLLCIGVGVGAFLFSEADQTPVDPKLEEANVEESYPKRISISDLSHIIIDEDMEKLANEAFSPIDLYDESGEYRVDDMVDLIQNRILENPIFGDMVACGMLEAFSKGDYNDYIHMVPYFQEFINATDMAMNDPEDAEKAGMRRWLTKSHDIVYTTDEYKEYIGQIYYMLGCFYAEIHNMKITSYWEIDSSNDIMSVRTVQRKEERIEPALVFFSTSGGETYDCMFGILIENGSFAIRNPDYWGADSFAE